MDAVAPDTGKRGGSKTIKPESIDFTAGSNPIQESKIGNRKSKII
jgi:hypothetical protein